MISEKLLEKNTLKFLRNFLVLTAFNEVILEGVKMLADTGVSIAMIDPLENFFATYITQ